jgi:L-alanine-DL-glutamate epimerase-like enolase superfamily enzyme
VRDEATSMPAISADGRVRVPEAPGLGVTVDRAALKRFAA